jgi:ribonuclease HI
MLNAYTDGACSDNQSDKNTGGWAWSIFDNQSVIEQKSGGEYDTTNNIMEAKAIYDLIVTHSNDDLRIHTDSELCINWLNGTYKIKVKNERDKIRSHILHETIDLIGKRQKNGIKTEFVKIKGHSGHKENDYVDRLAVEQTSILKKNRS